MWIQQVCKRTEGTATDTASLKNILTDTFNHILLEDVEDCIKTHMKVWECDRLTVEFQIIKVVAEIFSEQKPQEVEKIPVNPMPQKSCLKNDNFFQVSRHPLGTYSIYGSCLQPVKQFNIATVKTAESCYNLRKRGTFMPNANKTIQQVNLEDDFLFAKVMSDKEICRMERGKHKKAILPKRSRYYQGNIDLVIISAGEDYRKLKKSFVIFICTFDPFGNRRHLYTFENRCIENPSLTLGDETTKIFLNTKGNMHDVDPEMQEFLSYVENTTDDFAS